MAQLPKPGDYVRCRNHYGQPPWRPPDGYANDGFGPDLFWMRAPPENFAMTVHRDEVETVLAAPAVPEVREAPRRRRHPARIMRRNAGVSSSESESLSSTPYCSSEPPLASMFKAVTLSAS